MKKRICIIFIILFFVLVSVGVFHLFEGESRTPTITISQSAYSSNGEFWTYELSTEDVIKECAYDEGIFGEKHQWSFEQIGVGEVTITWNAHEGGIYDEKNSYSVTYYFDEDGTYTVLEDTREAK